MALSLGAPHIDPSLYNWRPSTENPNLYTRRALGVETKWARQALGTRQMFLGGSFSLTSPYSDLTLAEFGRAAERASLKLRSEFPEVILRPSSGQGEDGSLLLELSIPESDGEATEWAKRSLFLDTCEDGKSVEEELRQAVIEEPVGLRLNARVDQEGKVAGAEFAFRSDHMTTDGVGAYILAGYFFKFLAHAVGGREETFDWDAMKRRIPIPWIDMMNSEQSIEGKIFEEGIKVITNLLIEAAKSQWGIKVLSNDGYMPKAIHKRFSVEESKAILLAVKEKLGKACSITQLGHAAMVMTMLKFKPAPERPLPGACLVSPLFMNGRRYLDQGILGSRSYISLCRAFSAVEFRDVENYILSDNPSKEEIQGKLRLACSEAFRSYQAVRDQKFDLKAFKGKGTANAFFLSDGLIETHISNSYCDETETHKVLEVDDLQFTANPDGPSLIIRISTFRQATNLSAEWDGVYHAEEDVRSFLNSVSDLLLSLISE